MVVGWSVEETLLVTSLDELAPEGETGTHTGGGSFCVPILPEKKYHALTAHGKAHALQGCAQAHQAFYQQGEAPL